ncbi:MAG: cytochrome c [Pseudomonadota bacterium]
MRSGAIAVALLLALPVAAKETPAEAYQRVCGICHLDAGQGVPHAFPPLGAELGGYATTPAGRDYLVGVLANGLFGPIEVDGISYAGAMPPMRGQLDETAMAQLLNFVLTEFAGSEAGAFDATEVAERLERIGTSPGASLRP